QQPIHYAAERGRNDDVFGAEASAALRAHDRVLRMIFNGGDPIAYEPRAMPVEILLDEGGIFRHGQIAVLGVSLRELEGIEARMHAADHVEVEPPVPFELVPDAAVASRDDEMIDAVALELAQQWNGRKTKADNEDFGRDDVFAQRFVIARRGEHFVCSHGNP